jgi:hypothetical protein
MSTNGRKLSKADNDPLSGIRDPNKKEWVKFEDDDTAAALTNGAKVFFSVFP